MVSVFPVVYALKHTGRCSAIIMSILSVLPKLINMSLAISTVISFTNNRAVKIDILVFTIYNDEFVMDVESGLALPSRASPVILVPQRGETSLGFRYTPPKDTSVAGPTPIIRRSLEG